MVTNQQKSWKSLKIISDKWEISLKNRANNFFLSTLKSLEQINLETSKINSNFEKLSSLKIDPKWGFIYPKIENYFDKDSIRDFSINLSKKSKSLKQKVLEEKTKIQEKFKKKSLFIKMEEKLKKKGIKKFGNIKSMNQDKFQMLEELSQGIRKGDPANKE